MPNHPLHPLGCSNPELRLALHKLKQDSLSALKIAAAIYSAKSDDPHSYQINVLDLLHALKREFSSQNPGFESIVFTGLAGIGCGSPQDILERGGKCHSHASFLECDGRSSSRASLRAAIPSYPFSSGSCCGRSRARPHSRATAICDSRCEATMKIKDGFESQQTEIAFDVGDRTIRLWIKHDSSHLQDVMVYLTPAELHDLLCDVQDAARKLFRLE